MKTPPPAVGRFLRMFLLAGAAIFFGLHFAHLTADFPNYSPWMDWSKYTDEGWYGDAAIRHFQLGHWYVAGDFNPAAALPVWPLLEAVVFEFTGVSLAAARALTVCVFGGILAAAWLLLARRAGPAGFESGWAGPVAVLLLAVSPFCFVFTRIAIIEPLLILLTLLALLAATAIRTDPGSMARLVRLNLLPMLALGLLLPLMVLTKTTALFLMPGIFWMLFAAAGYRLTSFVRLAIFPVLAGGVLWLVYFLAIVRPHFLADYRYLFAANAYTGMDRENFVAVLAVMLTDGRWMGSVLYPLALAAEIFCVAQGRRLAAHPLVVALLLWSAGYMGFLAYHNNMQPRYYLVVAVPLMLLLPVVLEDLILPRLRSAGIRRVTLVAAAVVASAIVVSDAGVTLGFVRRPQYTLVRAVDELAGFIRRDRKADPAHNPLILSISGSDISLITGLPSICDDFGTLELVDRVKKYQPGWYVAWNQVEDDKLDAIAPQFRLERVAEFPALDDPDRNLLILYKLEPAHAPAAPNPPRQAARVRGVKTGQPPREHLLDH